MILLDKNPDPSELLILIPPLLIGLAFSLITALNVFIIDYKEKKREERLKRELAELIKSKEGKL